MDDRYARFCDEVCDQVDHATAREKRGIAQELSDHLQDHADALIALGRSPEEAGNAAVAAMGDPKEIGRALNKEYPLLWLVLSRIAGVLIVLAAATLLLLPSSIYHAVCNLQTRRDPFSGSFAQMQEEVRTPVDYRYDLPCGDVLRVYSLDVCPGGSGAILFDSSSVLDQPDAEWHAVISMCCYDRTPFRPVSQFTLQSMQITGSSGMKRTSGSGGGNDGVSMWTEKIPLQYGDEYLYLDYSAYGFTLHEAIPLNWEGLQ